MINYFRGVTQAILFFLACILISGLSTQAQPKQVRQYFVSTKGNDGHSGAADKPFATIGAAKASIAKLKKQGYQGSVELIIDQGTYYLKKPLVFGAEESGTMDAPYTIKAATGKDVILSGAIPLRLTWKKYNDHIWKARIPNGINFESLYADGRELIRARYPNFDPKVLPFFGYAADAIDSTRTKKWKNPAGGYVHALHEGGWGGFHFLITGKEKDGTLKLTGGQQNNRPSPMHEKYRFVENIFEELDDPGEWYLDRDQNILYFYPQEGQHPEKMQFEASHLENLILLIGSEERPIHDIHISGIKFIYTAPTFMKTSEPLLRSDWTIYRQGAIKIEGAERCVVENSDFRNLGGNAIFVSNYNRDIIVRGNLIEYIGGGAINFVGNPTAVRSSSFRYEEFVPEQQIDTTRGPRSNQYPSNCVAMDNLIHGIGRIEKQVAGVQIAMAYKISVLHNSIYDVPRAGINIGDGTWGGHLLAYNDVFRTVLETSDHGAFNSWGRDRFWHPDRKEMDRITSLHPEWTTLDAMTPTVLRNNRFQCDHGWDIDLDDGSSNYLIYENLCLSGGLKLREGFYRNVFNNVMVNNGFHPHVWFKDSHDVFRNNIVMRPHAAIQVKYWGDTVDYNFYLSPQHLAADQKKGVEQNGKVITPEFVDVAHGDFKPIDMNQVGVQSSRLKKKAESPKVPAIQLAKETAIENSFEWRGVRFKSIETLGEQSAAGIPTMSGVLVLRVAPNSPIKALQGGDVILQCEGLEMRNLTDWKQVITNNRNKRPLTVKIFRNQRLVELNIENQ